MNLAPGTTYTDDGRSFYTAQPSRYPGHVTLTETRTGFELHMSERRFYNTFREATEPKRAA